MERITIETSSQILNELYKKAAICEKSCRFIDPEWINYDEEDRKVAIEVSKTKWLIIEVLEYFKNDDVDEWVIVESREWIEDSRIQEVYYLSEKWIKLVEDQITLVKWFLEL